MSMESQVASTRKIESVLMSYASGNEDDGDAAYVSMSLCNGHLSILISQAVDKRHQYMDDMADLLKTLFSIVGTVPSGARDEGNMPVGFFDEIVEGCQELFSRYRETPFSRYGYLSAAAQAGNISILDSFRDFRDFRDKIGAEGNDIYRQVVIGLDGRPNHVGWPRHTVSMGRDEVSQKFDVALLEEADRFFQAKKRVNGAWVLPPSKRVNGVLIEMPMASTRPT